MRELLHAAHHQSRGDQQHERERDLCGHQQLSRAMLTARRGLPAAAVVQGRGDRREAQERDRAEHERREQAQRRGEDDDHRIDPDFVEPRQSGGTERDQQTNTAPGEREAKRAADHSEQRALRQEVARQPSRAGAERATDRDFTVTRFRANEEQVGDVRARHEQHEADRREQDPERAGDVADERIVHRQRRGDDARLIRSHASELFDQARDLRARRCDRCVVAQPGDGLDGEQKRRRRACRLCRQPQLDQRSRERERGGHDADDGRGHAVDQDGAADDGWIRAEAPHPEAMRQHGNVRRTRCALGLGEPSAERGRRRAAPTPGTASHA